MRRISSAYPIACVAGSVLLFAAPTTIEAAVIDVTRDAVDQIRGRTQDPDARPLGYFTSSTETTVGVTGGSGQRHDNNIVYRYLLPTLNPGETIESFSFTFQITGLRDHNGDKFELDVYLLDVVDPTTTGTDLFFHGANDTDHELVGSHFIDAGSNSNTINLDPAVNVTFNINSGPALALLQSFYGGDHIPEQTWASFRFNLDQLYVNSESDPLGSTGINRYSINNDVSTSSFEITAIPEPTTALLGGLGSLMLLRRRR